MDIDCSDSQHGVVEHDTGQSDVSDEEEDRDCSLLEKRKNSIVSWEKFIACISLTGRRSTTADQYIFWSTALRTANENVKLATYKTVRSKYWKKLLQHCFARSSVQLLDGKARIKNTEPLVRSANNGYQDPSDCARIVLPSEWAKLDVLSLAFYNDVYVEQKDSRSRKYDIEQSPIVQHRSVLTEKELTLWADFNDCVCHVEEGDIVDFPCSKEVGGKRDRHIRKSWSRICREDEQSGHSEIFYRGVVSHGWYVSEERCAPPFSFIRNHWKDVTEEEDDVLHTIGMWPCYPVVESEIPKSRKGEKIDSILNAS